MEIERSVIRFKTILYEKDKKGEKMTEIKCKKEVNR